MRTWKEPNCEKGAKLKTAGWIAAAEHFCGLGLQTETEMGTSTSPQQARLRAVSLFVPGWLIASSLRRKEDDLKRISERQPTGTS
jgi:hypothetical protein